LDVWRFFVPFALSFSKHARKIISAFCSVSDVELVVMRSCIRRLTRKYEALASILWRLQASKTHQKITCSYRFAKNRAYMGLFIWAYLRNC